jgi:uncharacterized protein (TIGR02246 family)
MLGPDTKAARTGEIAMWKLTRQITVLLTIAMTIAACGGGMSEDDINGLAERSTAAWNSGDPQAVAMLYAENGSWMSNGSELAVGRDAIAEFAADLMSEIPDLAFQMTDLRMTETGAVYHWRMTGTNTGPGGTGAPIDINGYDEWTFDEDGLLLQSHDHYDVADYQAQLNAPRPLAPGSSNADIVAHLMQHERNQTQTDALAINFPDLSRERAYAIQRQRIAETATDSDPLAGWKLGWTRLADASEPLDPIMGHYLRSRINAIGQPVSTQYFTNGTANAEPEIVFYLGKDLPGPSVTREEVIEAIESVGIAMEFVNWRALEPRTREHAIADNGIASGVILGTRRFDVRDLDFSQIEGSVTVNSAETSTGKATSIMGKDPIEGLLWAANELPKYGMHLRAGQFIVSGTVCPPLPVSAGDRARIAFTGMGSIDAMFVD